MALINCPECKRAGVSSSAKACPGCGYNVASGVAQIRREAYENSPEGKKAKAEEERRWNMIIKGDGGICKYCHASRGINDYGLYRIKCQSCGRS